MACNCNKSKCKCAKGNSCDPSFTGDINYDGNDFVCENEESLNVESGANLNTILYSILTTLCALVGIDLNNVGTGAGIYKDKVGYVFNLRSIVGGPGVTITENTDEILIEVEGGGGGTGTHTTAYCSTDRLGGTEGSTVAPGSTLTGSSYTIPVGESGVYEYYYTVDSVIPASFESQIRLDKNNIEVSTDAKRILQNGSSGNLRMNTTMLVCNITCLEGDVLDVKGYKTDEGVSFNNAVTIIKKVG